MKTFDRILLRGPEGPPLRLRSLTVSTLVCLFVGASASYAQDEPRGEVGAQITTLALSEFDTTDLGVGLHVGWRLSSLFSVDGALTWFPGGDQETFPRIEAQQRLLAVAGIRAGGPVGPLEIFARARPGFLRFGAEDNVVCILIFPPPLVCQVLAGHTAFATEVGGGVRAYIGVTRRMFVSVDAADLLVRYRNESIRSNGEVVTDGFLSHNPMVTAGVGWRF